MKMLSLFSGIGGIDLAAEWAGIETEAFCEIDQFCQQVLNKHWPDIPIYPDIRKLRGDMFDGIDIVAGGFPCQPFSQSGKRQSENDNRYLWPEMLRVIRETKPRWVIGENVIGIVNLALDTILSDLENEGYKTETYILPACSIGAPHRRYRVFIISNSTSNRNHIPKEKIQSRRESSFNSDWWKSEPSVDRVAHGVSSKLDRCKLKALGNAVVPQQIYPIFKAITEVEYA